MGRVHYSVVATLPNKDLLRNYMDWLVGGHIQAVLAGGAESARVVELDADRLPLRVRTVYEFPDRGAFERYVLERAPALRAEGLARFGGDSGVTFEREVGVIQIALRGNDPARPILGP